MVLKTLLERHFESKTAKTRAKAKLEREKLRAEFERGIEQGIEAGRQLEREDTNCQTERQRVATATNRPPYA